MSDVLWPNGSTVHPPITSPYGPRRAPVAGASTFHRGTDFVGYSTVRAVAAGQVKVVGTPNGWAAGGAQVWVQHDGFLTRSMHLSSTAVRVGQFVRPGDALGVMGRSGNVDGVHHHLEVVVNGVQVDPVPFLTARIGAVPSGGGSTEPAPSPSIVWEDDMPTLISSDGGQSLAIEGAIIPLANPEEVQSIRIAPGSLTCSRSVHARINATVGARTSDALIVNVIGGNGTRYVWEGGVLTMLADQQTIDQFVAMGARAVDWKLEEVDRILAEQS